jgi:hypothetical protein
MKNPNEAIPINRDEQLEENIKIALAVLGGIALIIFLACLFNSTNRPAASYDEVLSKIDE